MKTRGKANTGILSSHFSSTAYIAALDTLISFKSKTAQIDYWVVKVERKEMVNEAPAPCLKVRLIKTLERSLMRQERLIESTIMTCEKDLT